MKKPIPFYHVTDKRYDHPIIDPITSGPNGFGGDAEGKGFYGSDNKPVMKGYVDSLGVDGYVRKHKIPYGFRLLHGENIPAQEIIDFFHKVNTTFFKGMFKEPNISRSGKIYAPDEPNNEIFTFNDLSSLWEGFLDNNGIEDPDAFPLNNYLFLMGYDGKQYSPYQIYDPTDPRHKEQGNNYLIWNAHAINNPRKFVEERHYGIDPKRDEQIKQHQQYTSSSDFILKALLKSHDIVDLIKNNYKITVNGEQYDFTNDKKRIYDAFNDYVAQTLRLDYSDSISLNTALKIYKDGFKVNFKDLEADLSEYKDILLNSIINNLRRGVNTGKEENQIYKDIFHNNFLMEINGVNVDFTPIEPNILMHVKNIAHKELETDPQLLIETALNEFKTPDGIDFTYSATIMGHILSLLNNIYHYFPKYQDFIAFTSKLITEKKVKTDKIDHLFSFASPNTLEAIEYITNNNYMIVMPNALDQTTLNNLIANIKEEIQEELSDVTSFTKDILSSVYPVIAFNPNTLKMRKTKIILYRINLDRSLISEIISTKSIYDAPSGKTYSVEDVLYNDYTVESIKNYLPSLLAHNLMKIYNSNDPVYSPLVRPYLEKLNQI